MLAGVDALTDALHREYGLTVTALHAVAGGADPDATVWRAEAPDAAYAVKLSRRGLDVGVRVVTHLAAHGVAGLPVPLATRTGRPYARLDGAWLTVTGWLPGTAGQPLSVHAWHRFGALLAAVHQTRPPAGLPTDTYPPHPGVATVRRLDARIRAARTATDAPIAELTRRWREHADRIAALLHRIDTLAATLRRTDPPRVLTHGDAHAANVLVDGDAGPWLIDWDGARLAPVERDLMFAVAGISGSRPVTADQTAAFLAGYGPVDIDPDRLAYYRTVRAVEDLSYWPANVLDTTATPAARSRASAIVADLLSPHGILTVALT